MLDVILSSGKAMQQEILQARRRFKGNALTISPLGGQRLGCG
jgi:hypothetical protein